MTYHLKPKHEDTDCVQRYAEGLRNDLTEQCVVSSQFSLQYPQLRTHFRRLKFWSYLERTIKVLFINPIKPINPMKVFIPPFHGRYEFHNGHSWLLATFRENAKFNFETFCQFGQSVTKTFILVCAPTSPPLHHHHDQPLNSIHSPLCTHPPRCSPLPLSPESVIGCKLNSEANLEILVDSCYQHS